MPAVFVSARFLELNHDVVPVFNQTPARLCLCDICLRSALCLAADTASGRHEIVPGLLPALPPRAPSGVGTLLPCLLCPRPPSHFLAPDRLAPARPGLAHLSVGQRYLALLRHRQQRESAVPQLGGCRLVLRLPVPYRRSVA